jgi:hypothetical protein
VGENLAYALVQVVHNFGAAAVLGGAAFALWPAYRPEYARSFVWLILVGWAAQIASGALFGVTSLYYYGETPDLSRIAQTALGIKVIAALSGFLLAGATLIRGRNWDSLRVKRRVRMLVALAIVALTAAAFLRWFS